MDFPVYISALDEVFEEMVSRRDAQSLFEVIARKVKDIFSADGVAMGMWVDEKWVIVASAGLAQEVARQVSAINKEDGLFRTGLSERLEIFQTLAMEQDAACMNDPLVRALGGGSLVSAPLMIAGENIGTLDLWRSEGGLLSQEELKALGSFAAMAAVAAHSLEDFKQLTEGLKNVQAAFHAAKILDKRKGDFLSHLSHELRSPMVIIRGWLELILRGQYGDLSPKQRHGLKVSLRNIDKLVTLVDNLKAVSKMRSLDVALHLQPVLVRQLLSECLREVHPQAKERGVILQSEVHLDPETISELDYAMMRDALAEVLKNAILHSRQGGHVHVWASMASGKGDGIGAGLRMWAEQRQISWRDLIVVSVADEGPGIPEEVKNRLFLQLLEMEDHHGEPLKGLGMVKEYLNLHEGDVFLESLPNSGTTVLLAWPLVQPS